MTFVSDLIAKHILDRGTLSLVELARGLMLAGSILETVLEFMRSEALVEIRPNRAEHPGLHYALTEQRSLRGARRNAAQRLRWARSGAAETLREHRKSAKRLQAEDYPATK